MTFNAGDVVMLKSGGQALTVAAVEDGEATCLWIGEEGDLFRERIPLVALTGLEEDGPEDEEDEEEDGEDDEEEDGEEE
ncbi:MAG: YodC family protein [Phreatobacter sp.]